MSAPDSILPVAPAVGDKLTLTIEDIAFGGEGVARVNGFVIFVPFVLVGEMVEAEITEAKTRFARAKLLRILQTSPERVNPLCRYFGECGGCQYQHIAYPAQLRLKHKQIADLFQRLGGFDPKLIEPVLPCPQPYGYRNRIMIRSQWDKFKQGLNIGFIRADNRLVVDIEECKIAEPALNEQIKYVRANPPPKGGLKVVLAHSTRRLAGAARFLLPEQFLPAARIGGNRRRDVPPGRRPLPGGRLLRRRLLQPRTGRPGRALCRRRIGRYGDQSGAAERLGPWPDQRRVRRRRGGRTPARLLLRVRPPETAVVLDPPRKGCQPICCNCCSGCDPPKSSTSPATRPRWRAT